VPGMARVPIARVVADTRLRTPLGARLVRTARAVPTWIATRTGQPPAALAPFLEAGVEILPVRAKEGGLDLVALLGALAQRGVTRVLTEVGAGVAAGLLPAVRPLPLTRLSAMPRFRRVASRAVGEDWLTEFEREDSEPQCSQGS
jgi:diaminohydroxyphosphoribosylaminopyrimidine deaminase/5-amino-6-(5-phosphoribosylamino)uracil reductase